MAKFFECVRPGASNAVACETNDGDDTVRSEVSGRRIPATDPPLTSVTRREVLEQLAVESDADTKQTTNVEDMAVKLEIEEPIVEHHLERLQGCKLVRRHADGRVRITLTGEELLELDPDDMIIVDSSDIILDG